MSDTNLIERTAQIAAHRACCGTEHNPAEGKLHGFCVVCGVPWPCDYAGKPPTPLPALEGAALRNMLRAMQSGEMTVSRGIELVDMWLAGNYRDEQLPPVRNELGDDEMPWDRIDKLAAQNNDMLTELNTAWQQIKTEQRLSFRDQVADLTRQRDDLLAAAQAMIDRWDTPLWKDVPSTAEYINAMRHAVAKVKS